MIRGNTMTFCILPFDHRNGATTRAKNPASFRPDSRNPQEARELLRWACRAFACLTRAPATERSRSVPHSYITR